MVLFDPLANLTNWPCNLKHEIELVTWNIPEIEHAIWSILQPFGGEHFEAEWTNATPIPIQAREMPNARKYPRVGQTLQKTIFRNFEDSFRGFETPKYIRNVSKRVLKLSENPQKRPETNEIYPSRPKITQNPAKK